MGLLLFIRRENAIDLDLDDEIDETYQDDDEDSQEAESEEVVQKESITKRTPPKRTPPQKKRVMYSTSVQPPIVSKKRQVVNSDNLNKDGPIMKTKRKVMKNRKKFFL